MKNEILSNISNRTTGSIDITSDFIYKVTGITKNEAEEINVTCNLADETDRIYKIYEIGGNMVYYNMKDKIFKRNLVLLDSGMPQIIGNMLLCFYKYNIKDCNRLLEYLYEMNPLEYKDTDMYKYKFKKFLCSCYFGMKSDKPWRGIAEAKEVYITSEDDNCNLVHYVFDKKKFEQYLVNNTIFEGEIETENCNTMLYENNGEIFTRLSLQMKFI